MNCSYNSIFFIYQYNRYTISSKNSNNNIFFICYYCISFFIFYTFIISIYDLISYHYEFA